MALRGFLGPNTYSVVELRSIDKQSKSLSFDVITYRDDTKLERISVDEISWAVDRHDDVQSIGITTWPAGATAGSKYIVGVNSDPRLSSHENNILVCHGGDKWGIKTPHEGTKAKNLSNNQWVVFDGSAWVALTGEDFSESVWDQKFDYLTLEQDGNNEIAAIYSHLKTLPAWQHTVDA